MLDKVNETYKRLDVECEFFSDEANKAVLDGCDEQPPS